jgi:EAL domain-containing protein (putative c-di-GMP-specific phosphodiesterase class I)
VEQAGQGEELRRMGCRFAQGYYFARPESLAATLELLATQAPAVSRV